MKTNLFRMLRSALALLLAFCMVVGYVPAAVFALSAEDALRFENFASLTAEERAALVQDLYTELKTNGYIETENEQLKEVNNFYQAVTKTDDTTGEQLLPEAALDEIFDQVVEVVGKEENYDEQGKMKSDAVTDLTADVTNTVLTHPEIKTENKATILDEVIEVVDKVTSENTTPDVDEDEDEDKDEDKDEAEDKPTDNTATYLKYLKDLDALTNALAAEGYMSAEQEGKIMEAVAGVLVDVLKGKEPTEEELKTVAIEVYNIIFEEPGLNPLEKIEVLMITYDVLDELGYVDMGYAYGYVEADEQGYIAEAVAYIDDAIEALEDAKKEAEAIEVPSALAGTKADLLAEIDATINTLNKIKALLESDALSTREDARVEMMDLMSGVDKHVAKLIAFWDSLDGDTVGEKLDTLKKLVTKALDDASEAVKKQLYAILDETDVLLAEVAKLIETMDGTAKEQAQNLYDAVVGLRNATENVIDNVNEETLHDLYKASVVLDKAVKEAAEVLSEEAMEQIQILVDRIIEIVNELYWGATHDFYYVSEDSYYVAIGDGTAASNSYVDALAAKLGVEYKNLAENGMMVADALALLDEQVAEIEKADLVTVGFGSNSFLDYAIDRAVRQEIADRTDAEVPAPLNWATYVGADGAVAIEKALAEVNKELNERGLNETTLEYDVDIMGTVVHVSTKVDVAKLMTGVVESYAYAVVSYAIDLPKIVDEIHEINDEAVVAIVGMYNPVDAVAVSVGESALEIGEYVDYLVCAANVHNFAYALLTDKAIFVEADEVETQIVAEGEGSATVDALDFLLMYINADLGAIKDGELDTIVAPCGEETNPSAKGHDYIKTQVYDALVLLSDVEIEMTRMILGNELAMQFAFKKAPIDERVDYTAVITKTYADGRAAKVVEVPKSEWKSATINGADYYYVSFNGIAAKEMGDDVSVKIVAMNKYVVSNNYSDSIEAYAVRQLRKSNDDIVKALYVDMLNYGAAAQTYIGYNVENLANAELTEEEQAFATEDVELENNLVAGENYVASQLNLANSIQLRVKFDNIDASMNAVVEFTSHTGRDVKVEIPGSEFLHGGVTVMVDEIVAADYAQDVTITVYNANGEEVASVVDSIASYIARMFELADDEIYGAVAKYTASAYAYLHSR